MTNDSKTTDPRTELARLLGIHFPQSAAGDDYLWSMADVIMGRSFRKPHTITTVEELEASPIGLIVRDGDREPWERTDNGWNCWVYGGQSFASRDLVLPATVLYEPESEATR